MARSRASLPCSRIALGLLLGGLLAPAFGAEPVAVAGEAAWRAASSDGVEARVDPMSPVAATGARLDFDFHGGAGFALLDRALPLDFPSNYEISIAIRSSAADNDLEIKFVDASGDNVWWYRPPPGRIGVDWQTLRIRQREIEFAWGPTASKHLERTARIEIALHAGHGVGHGTLDVGAIVLTPVVAPPASWPAARLVDPTHPAAMPAQPAPDGSAATAWACPAAPCTFALDYGVAREFGGLMLRWSADTGSSLYTVGISDDGTTWRAARSVAHSAGATDWLWLGESEARYVRVLFLGLAPGGVRLEDIGLLDIGVGTHVNEFVATVAKAGRRGEFPRGFSEQSYWTLVGTDGGADTALLSEDGALELGRGAPSIEPFVIESGRVVTWADVSATQRLEDGYLPIPTVEWKSTKFTLEISAVAHRTQAGEGLWARYRLSNRTAKPLALRHALAARPFQVNPPAQFLTTPGGVSPIDHVEWNGSALVINRNWRVEPLTAPTATTVYAFQSHAIPAAFAMPGSKVPDDADDAGRLTSAAMAFDIKLAPGGHAEVGLFIPWAAAADAIPPCEPLSSASLVEAFSAESRYWRQRLNRVTVRAAGSAEAREVSDGLRTALAHIVLSRSGPLLRPGTRAYARSWIRDGAMMSDALLRLGEQQLPRDYLLAYSRYLFPDGKVPCCVDERGADPVPENDSPGEFIHLAASVLKATGDEELARSVWSSIRVATGYLDRLRADERRSSNSSDPAFAGLLPPSISHEGYSAKPMHSYWDDFWGLRGYSDAVYVASRLGHAEDARAFEASRRDFARDVLASIDVVTRRRGIDYIPGAADLGDFDATSTTIALNPGIGAVALPRPLLESTFGRYWRNFVARRDGALEWHDYTPYEWRVVGSFVRLGQPERALGALRFFMDGRRPAGWRQWPEVIDRDPRHARFIGDLPHGWVASDFMRATLDLFAFEREADSAVVIAAGLPAGWIAREGVEVKGLLTRAGPVNYRLTRRGPRTELTLLAGSALPTGGFIYREPAHRTGARVLEDGQPARFENGELHIDHVPAEIALIDP